MNPKDKTSFPSTNTNKNKNDVKVNNQFSLTINFGDSLNIIALITGIYVLKKIAKRNKKGQ
ncbi:hypothetical protein HPT25_18045 [Bacillus sp. BRMEA1]|uniref:hypothetical protein n=1 Tax=Neobacillus endophyticus TaxID=2738405 RepID=UPI001562F10B|nr:hypothetical protein [Neobacillus endophyticus]NRD79264.1 hypothetical protein [Neobacillus endophyticus]